VGNKNNSSLNIIFVAKTSDVRNSSENISSGVKTSEVAARAYARGGVTPPLRLRFYKNRIKCAKEINCFHILFSC